MRARQSPASLCRNHPSCRQEGCGFAACHRVGTHSFFSAVGVWCLCYSISERYHCSSGCSQPPHRLRSVRPRIFSACRIKRKRSLPKHFPYCRSARKTVSPMICCVCLSRSAVMARRPTKLNTTAACRGTRHSGCVQPAMPPGLPSGSWAAAMWLCQLRGCCYKLVRQSWPS